jgi:hypothetical protein
LIEPFGFRMGLSDRHEHRLRIGRLSHGLGFGIMAILAPADYLGEILPAAG